MQSIKILPYERAMGGLGRLVLLPPLLPHLGPHDQHVFLPVEDQGGKVGQDQAVHAPTCPCQVDMGVEAGCGEGACEDAHDVDQRSPDGALAALQGQADCELHDDVEDNVGIARVNHRVGEVPPCLPPGLYNSVTDKMIFVWIRGKVCKK